MNVVRGMKRSMLCTLPLCLHTLQSAGVERIVIGFYSGNDVTDKISDVFRIALLSDSMKILCTIVIKLIIEKNMIIC